MSINVDLMAKAMAHSCGVGDSSDTEFEIRRGMQEWNKMTDLSNRAAELMAEGQKREGRYKGDDL